MFRTGINSLAALALSVVAMACGGGGVTGAEEESATLYALILTHAHDASPLGDTLYLHAVDDRRVKATAQAVGGYIPATAKIIFDGTRDAATLASSQAGELPSIAVATVAGAAEGVTVLRASLVDGGRVLATAAVPVRVFPVMRTVARGPAGDSMSTVMWNPGSTSGVPAFAVPIGTVQTIRFTVVDAQTGKPLPGKYTLKPFQDPWGSTEIAGFTATEAGAEVSFSALKTTAHWAGGTKTVYIEFASERVPNSPHQVGFAVRTFVPEVTAQAVAAGGRSAGL